MSRPTLLIFAKTPRIGLSKTRLADDVGRVEARRIARFVLARTMRVVHDPAWQSVLMITPRADLHQTLGGLWPSHVSRKAQGKGDLGDRLIRGMEAAPAGPVIFIGTDTPDINTAHIHEAARALRHDGAVFGPARDGGFWLFGISHRLRDASLFRDVRWSSPHAMEDVWSNLPPHARVSLLPNLIDIDTSRDWELYKRQRK
jgi:rSAM/selenodomain-associated transferase 1